MRQVVKNVKIIGTGSYIPETVYTNQYLETIIPTNDAWIRENLGIRERHIIADGETTSDLAARAAKAAIHDAKLTVDDIDLIIVATATPDRKAPSTAAIVQDKIKAYNAAAFDISVGLCYNKMTPYVGTAYGAFCKNRGGSSLDRKNPSYGWNCRNHSHYAAIGLEIILTLYGSCCGRLLCQRY
mgnify:CR=1 FL=1